MSPRARLWAVALPLLLIGVAVRQAAAATSSGNLGISATLQATCVISVSPLAFGTYTGVVSNATATITITCTKSTAYNVGLDVGQGGNATSAQRILTGPSGTAVGYTMSQNAAHTINWGPTVGSDTVAGVGTGAAQTLTVYGQIFAGQYAVPGAYSDVITAAVTY